MNVANSKFYREATAFPQDAVDQFRLRSDGVLTSQQLHWCRANGIPLAFDPMQCGWVPQYCENDMVLSYPDYAKYPAYPVSSGFEFRPWTSSDAPRLAEMLSSERLWQYLPEDFHGPINVQAAAELIEISHAPHHEVMAVVQGDSVVGQVRLLFDGLGVAEISYWLGEEHWGKGYGSKIVQAFCARSLRHHSDLHRLYARVHSGHKASRRILEKTGFVQSDIDDHWLILDLCRYP